ncbi:MAG: transposase [Candidatus Competibacteraceae bacterium]|nr:MAG: transposase [Candidatus Competibacteraceae bacterium]
MAHSRTRHRRPPRRIASCPLAPVEGGERLRVDLGYQGIKDHYSSFHKIYIPHKKPRQSKANQCPALTPQQKRENRAISRVRVGVEHLIGDLKIFQILIPITNRFYYFSADKIKSKLVKETTSLGRSD